MGTVLDHAERSWNSDGDEARAFSPLLAVEEIAPRTAFVSSFANVTALATDAGLLLADTGSFLLAAPTKGLVRYFSEAPVRAAVFTHGHVDHCFGVDLYEAEGHGKVTVYAHRAVPARFERYRMTRGYNSCINARQFQTSVQFPDTFRAPDVLYEREHVVELGGERFELHHARGETDDHTWLWAPERKVLCTGDLFIWVLPNAGNPQKVQRYPIEWARALRAMDKLGAEVLCPGHGPPILGAGRVREALRDTASLLESLHEQTLALMNAGARLDRVLREVKPPAHLLERPYLKPLYDEPEFVVRNIWRLYGGWYDGNPAHLKPGSDRALAEEVAHLAGGAARLAKRAQELSHRGEHALACHLAEMAGLAAPDDTSVLGARAEVYRARASAESSLMARGIYNTAADEKPAV